MTVEHDFRILGPLTVVVDGRVVPVPAPKLRVLLGALLLQPNKTVGVDELAERLWPDTLRRKAKATLHTYVWRLRQLLGDGDRLVTMPDGYQVRVEPRELDLARFRALSDQARTTDDLLARARVLDQALALWRGRALEDVPSDLMQTMDAPRLEEERLEVLERRFDVQLRLGGHLGVIGDLQAVVADHPLRERFHGQLMLALYRSGRQNDVFAVYRDLKRELTEQLGVDPTPELRQLHHRILTNDPAIAAPVERAPASDVRVPRELPMDVSDLVGRDKVKGQVVAQLTESRSGVPLVVISGQPGVGKTALAVHVAHELSARFPDGQLYADLRGHSSGRPLDPVELLPRFLISLGVPPPQVPKELDELTSLYRTLLADRKVLVLLDNVGTPQQVRPMLPNAPECAVIVTSRNELRGLTALQGAQPNGLDVLSTDEACVLLAGIVGPARIRSDDAGARELAELCGHLPLALRIAAANLGAQPDRSLADFAAELRRGNRLAALEIEGDEEATVRAAFALSYAALDERTARLFRLLGLIPGPDFTVAAVAALAAVSTEDSTRLLDRLATANLVNRTADTRYQLHDLLRLYAAERCHQEDDRAAIIAAKERLFQWYLLHLDATDMLYAVYSRLPRPPSDLPPVKFGSATDAKSWMDHDCLNVIAAVGDALDNGLTALAWSMAEGLLPYLGSSGRYRAEGLAACQAALRAAVDDGDARAEFALHTTMAVVHLRHSDPVRAVRDYTAALGAAETAGFVFGQARSLFGLGNAHQATGDLDLAAESVARGRVLAEVDGDRRLRLLGSLNLSLVELVRGNLPQCEQAGREALALCDETDGELLTRGESRTIFGKAVHWQGRCAEAIRELSAAVALFRQGSLPLYEANARHHLAAAYRERGDLTTALDHARAAVARARECGAKGIEVTARNTVATIHHAAGRHEQAVADYLDVLDLCENASHPYAKICVFVGLAEISLTSGDLVTADSHAHQALALSENWGLRLLRGRSKAILARTRLAEGDLHEAADLAESAIEIAHEAGAMLDKARALHVFGLARHAAGDETAAHQAWQQALQHVARSETPATTALHRLLVSLYRE
jgi:DNA-binding SARP family transcriptional activator/tetratricopeptide (TPR) repeat protein